MSSILESSGRAEIYERRIQKAIFQCALGLLVIAWFGATVAWLYYPQVWQGVDSPPKTENFLSDQPFILAQSAMMLVAVAALLYQRGLIGHRNAE